jgi:hypothetical protein
MSTLFQRLYKYRLEKLPLSFRQRLGELIKEDFFSQAQRKQYKKVTQREGSQEFKVLSYEKRYDSRMDEIILRWCKSHKFTPGLRTPRNQPHTENRAKEQAVPRGTSDVSQARQRKRIPAQQPAFRAKNPFKNQ